MKNKVVKILLGVAVSFLIYRLATIIIIIVFYNTHLWASAADYESYADDFNNVKDYIASTYPQTTDINLSISVKKGENVKVYDIDAKKYVEVPESIAESLINIDRYAFTDKEAYFYMIRIQKNRISFCISSGQYALVYSPDKKPTWVNVPEEDVDVKVKKIEKGWYHVVKNPR